MQRFTSKRLAAMAAAALSTLICASAASAQAPVPEGLGAQLFSTGGDITVEVLRSTAGLTSELRLYAPDGSFTPVALNRELGRIVILPARPKGEELVFGIFVNGPKNTFKLGPGERNPDGLPHGVVKQTGEGQFDVGFEDLLNGGDRDYDDNTFRFSGGLAPNNPPVADDQALGAVQGASVPVKLTATDADGDTLSYAVADVPRHGSLTGTPPALTYTPAADFTGTDTFGFTADDGKSPKVEGRITVAVTAAAATPGAAPTTGSGTIQFGPCPAGELTLVNVHREGRRVLVSGLAERTLAGAPVNIVEGGLVVVRALIGTDGRFSASVPVPTLRGGRVLRYQARLGRLLSRNLRLKRRMVTTSALLRGDKIVLSGRVAGGKRLKKRPVVDLFARQRGCGKTYVRIGRARLRRNGRFTVSAPPLQGADVAVYRASTRVPGKGRSYTLPQTIARR